MLERGKLVCKLSIVTAEFILILDTEHLDQRGPLCSPHAPAAKSGEGAERERRGFEGVASGIEPSRPPARAERGQPPKAAHGPPDRRANGPPAAQTANHHNLAYAR